jgi:hypothetical protein
MPACAICTLASVGYIQVFQGQQKFDSYPACIQHLIIAWAAQEIAQDWIRQALAEMLHIKKGTIPRFKVSLVP